MGIIKKFIKKILLAALSVLLNFLLIFTIMAATVIVTTTNKQSRNIYVGSIEGCPEEYIEYFNEASILFNIPPWMFAAIAKQESNFDYTAEGGGAYGLMQIQKYDTDENDLWEGLLDGGLDEVLFDLGYSFNDSEEIWDEYLDDPRLQIISGAYYVRHYANYVLYRLDYTNNLNYKSNENMNLIDWNSDEDEREFQTVLKRIFACYNGGPGYGMKVDLDKAQNNYPNKVFEYAMTYRGEGIDYNSGEYDGEIENVIEIGMDLVGVGTYVFGGGRTQEDVDNNVFDCSSFVYHCFEKAGIKLGDRGSVTTYSLVQMGTQIDEEDMQRGDIIFFNTDGVNSHVAIYLGDNKFLHDSTSKGVIVSELEGYYAQAFNGNVRRIIN